MWVIGQERPFSQRSFVVTNGAVPSDGNGPVKTGGPAPRSPCRTPSATADSRVSSLAAMWLTEIDDSELAAGTKRLYRFAVTSYVLPALGELRLREVTVPAVDRALRAVRVNHGAGAAKSARSVLSGMLTFAVRHGALATNPVRETSTKRTQKRTSAGPRALTVPEAEHLLASLTADAEARRLDLPDLVEFMLGTGVRIGEACAVRRPAVDLDDAALTIAATVVRVPGRGLVIQEFPKSVAGRRTIGLPVYVVDLLRRRQDEGRIPVDLGLFFPSPSGRLRDPHNASGDLRKVLDRAGFDWVTSHVFRKTVATRLDEAGLSARQIATTWGTTGRASPRTSTWAEACPAQRRLPPCSASGSSSRARSPTTVTRWDRPRRGRLPHTVPEFVGRLLVADPGPEGFT